MDDTSELMADLGKDLAALSPQQRKLLEVLLRKKGGDVKRLPIARADRSAPLPLSFGQQGLWLFDQAQPGSSAYTMPAVVRLSGLLHVETLRAALGDLVARHEILRTVFPLRDGRPVQEVLPQLTPAFECRDLSDLGEGREAYRRLLDEALRRPFDLAQGPLLRVLVLKLGEAEHLLVLCLHHIVGDRWSMGLLVEQWAKTYEARLTAPEKSPAAAAGALQYGDFAAWQRERYTGESEELGYWREQLAEVPQVLELPADRPRPESVGGAGGFYTRPLPPRVAGAADALASRAGASRFMVLLATFFALLSRYTGRDELVVGTPVAGRERPETQEVLGFFVNTLVLACDAGSDPTFEDLLARVRTTVLEAFRHQELPFDRLVEALRPQRDPRYSPLYQVMFTLQNLAIPLDRFGDLAVESLPSHAGSSQVDLTLVVSEEKKGLVAGWEYSRDLFDPARIERLAEHYQNLTVSALEAPALRLSQLALLSPGERRQLLEGFNPSSSGAEKIGGGPLLPALFTATARRQPEAVAVVAGGESLTFGQLEERSNRLAHHLLRLGAGPEVPVAHFLSRGASMVVAVLAILKSGAVYVPLDPANPAERLQGMLEDAAVRLVVTQSRLLPSLPLAGQETLSIDTVAAQIAAEPSTAPRATARPENLAYVIFTSGSTGRPKGVAVAQGAAAWHFESWRTALALGPEDRVCQFASLSFDASLEQMLPSLIAGARLVLRGDEVLSAQDFVRWAADEGLTVIYLPTAYWQQVTLAWEGQPAEGGGRPRLVNPGGDVMPPQAAARFRRSSVGSARLINGYGPTETVVTAAFFDVPADFHRGAEGVRVPIGRPFGDRQIYLLDRRGSLLPQGVPGELHVGGALLARGYLRRPALTAERFVPDPFSPVPGARMYRSGDLVRWLADGTLDFLGRVDHQVKVRGFRIELGEVEAALRRLPGVGQAVAVIRKPAGEDETAPVRLVAYAAPEPGARLTAETLRDELARHLPAAMMPTAFVVLDRLPTNAAGKIDRRALPEAETETTARGQATASAGEERSPAAGVEILLAGIWAQVLGKASVGVHENFFHLGGDSILSLQIISRAHEAGLRLTPAQFFRYPTVAQLAAMAEPVAGVSREATAEERAEPEGPIPLSPIQRWFFERDFAAPNHWNQAVMLEIAKVLEPDVLRQAAAAVVTTHGALRYRFEEVDGRWQQVAAPAGPTAPVRFVDLGSLSPEEQDAALAEEARRAQESLDLRRGPLVRFVLFALGGQRANRLLVVVHHLVMDGVSWRILLGDLEQAYEQAAARGGIELPAATTPFGRWSERLNELAVSEELAREVPYWQRQAPPVEPLLAPDHPEGSDEVSTAARYEVCLEAQATSRLLTEVPRAFRAQIQEVLLAALAMAFHEVNGCPRLGVELEGHGREDLFEGVDLSRTVGWFTAKYPLCLDLFCSGKLGPVAALKIVKQHLRSVPRRGLGYGVLRHLSAEPGALASLPEPELTFNYLGQFGQDAGSAGTRWPVRFLPGGAGPECAAANRLPRALEVVGMVVGERLELAWTYSAALYDEPTIAAVAQAFLRGLGELIRASEEGRPVLTAADFPLAAGRDGLTQDRLDQLVSEQPGLADLYPLSPVQEGMLFHSLLSPESGVYVEQLVCEVRGHIHVGSFQSAWRQVLDHHPALRTAFLWKGLAKPLQAVIEGVEALVVLADWSVLSGPDQKAQLKRFLHADRCRGFDLARPPLMRLLLARAGEERWWFVWTVHHLLIDGWAEPLILQDFAAAYQASREGRQASLPPRPPYRDYVQWLSERDEAAAESFWREELAGLEGPTLWPRDPEADEDGPQRHQEEQARLSPEVTGRLQDFARRQGLTMNTLVQAAWALLLSRWVGGEDLVFGLTVSGRPADLPGAGEMVGVFINTLPLRVRIDSTKPLKAWLEDLQGRTAELLQHEATPLVEVQGWSSLPRGEALFDTILVFMNLPQDSAALRRQAALEDFEIVGVEGVEQTNYPLTVTAFVQEAGLLLQINHQLHRCAPATARRILQLFELLFATMVESEREELTVEALLQRLASVERERRSHESRLRRSQQNHRFLGGRRKAIRGSSTATTAPAGLEASSHSEESTHEVVAHSQA